MATNPLAGPKDAPEKDDVTAPAPVPATGTIPVFVALILVGALLYGQVLNAPFVFDDTEILKDPLLLFTDLAPSRFLGLTQITTENVSPRLIPNLTFALNYYLGRRMVLGYHLVNLLVHIITAVLVFLISRRLMARYGISSALAPVAAALFWFVHPLHIQSVTYTWQRMNSLCALFFMSCLYFHTRTREHPGPGRSRHRMIFWLPASAGVISFLLALASKQTAAMLPIMLVIYNRFFFQNRETGRLKRDLLWTGLAIMIGFGLAVFYLGGTPFQTIQATYAEKTFSMTERLLVQPRVIIYYISLLVFPHPDRLTIDYDFPLTPGLLTPPAGILAVSALIALVIGAVYIAPKNRLISFAIIWFLGNLVIESSLIGLDLIYGYRTYLPSIFPVIALTAAFYKKFRPPTTVSAVILSAVMVSGWWTIQHNAVWKNAQTLWQDTVFKSPRKARPYHNLGLAYHAAGDCEKAVATYRKALRIRLAGTGPDHYKAGETWNNLGIAYDCLEQVENAADSYRNALVVFNNRFGPDHVKTSGIYNNLCVLYGRSENFDRAVGWCRKALVTRLKILGPDHPDVADLRNNLGLALLGAGAPDKARQELEAALRIYRRHLGDFHPRTLKCRQNLSCMPRGTESTVREIEDIEKRPEADDESISE